jgi:mono/diheme cytochrome c family protein
MSVTSRAWFAGPAVLMLAALATTSCYKHTNEDAASLRVTEADPVARGEYLVRSIGCEDCHTPGTFYGQPDRTRALSGSELGWTGPWGTTYARNLTPDTTTGLGKWSEQDIVNALHQGRRPDGSALLPPMPWFDFVWLSEDDAHAIARYLKTIPPIVHRVPDKLKPGVKPKGSYWELPTPTAWDVPTGG